MPSLYTNQKYKLNQLPTLQKNTSEKEPATFRLPMYSISSKKSQKHIPLHKSVINTLIINY